MEYIIGKNNFIRVILSFTLLQCLFVGAVAAPMPQLKNYELKRKLGIEAFDLGKYRQAKVHLKSALKAIKNEAGQVPVTYISIYYNLGVATYRLKQYNTSHDYFKRLVSSKKLAAAALYNLALIENKLGHKAAAISYLKKSKRHSGDRQFTALLDRQLGKLTHQAVKKGHHHRVKDWHAYLYLSPGYDSNIKFVPAGVASGESGRFIQLTGLFDKVLSGWQTEGRKSSLLVTGAVFLSNYFATDFNDYNLIDIGLRYLYPLDQWKNSLSINYKQSFYGHADYQRIYVATLATKRHFSHGDNLKLRYRYEHITSLNTNFNYLEGKRQKFIVDYSIKWPHDKLTLRYKLELNNRSNTVNFNYSPTRNTVRLRYEKKLNQKNRVFAETAYRRSDYDSTVVQDRLDKRATYGLAYIYDFTRDWQFMANWRLQNNHSTEAVFAYNRQVVLLTLRKTF